MKEIWKDVKDYEGRYQVSNLGRIKSLERIVKHSWGNYLQKEKAILGYIDKKGYKKIGLRKGEGLKYFMAHRLVAQAFIPNPKNYPFINHKDENKLNNCVDNLEWCDATYNNNYGTRNKKVSEKMKHHFVKAVEQYDLNGNLLNTYFSIKEASRKTGADAGGIGLCCRNKNKQCKNFIWKYKKGS